MASGGLQRSGPQLGDAQVQQRQRPQVVVPDRLGQPGTRRWQHLPGRDHGPIQIPPQPRPVQADRGQGDLKAASPSLGQAGRDLLGQPQVAVGPVPVAGTQPPGGTHRHQLGVGLHHLSRELVHQLAQQGHLAIQDKALPDPGQQLRGQWPVPAGQRVPGRLRREAMVLVPTGGPSVQLGH
jgi:hypothetical protein